MSHPQILRRTSSVLEKKIQDRPSFKAILARASSLDLGYGDRPSSAEAIASFFLRKQQHALVARLLELQGLQRVGLRQMMSLLWFASHCTLNASLLCGSLYKSILDAKLSIAHVTTILEAPSPYIQVGDLLLSLKDLQILLSGNTPQRIQEGQDLFLELDTKLKRYQDRARVRALSQISALKRRTHHGVSQYRLAMRAFKASLTNMFSMCNTGTSGGSNSDEEETLTQQVHQDGDDEDPLTHGMSPDSDVDDEDFDDNGAAVKPPGLHMDSPKPAYSGFAGFTPLHKAHVRLHKLEKHVHCIKIMFDTLNLLVEGIHRQTLNQRYIESLRNEPLMFDGVTEQIAVCHASLSKHLDDLKEQVLISFCFINNARDIVYFM